MSEKMAPDTLLFPVADALGITLNVMHEDHGQRIRGCQIKPLKIGPWKLEYEVALASDVLEPDLATFVVRVTSEIWLYMVSQPGELTIDVFNGGALGLKVKDLVGFCTGDMEKTYRKIEPVLQGAFVWNAKSEKWLAESVEEVVV